MKTRVLPMQWSASSCHGQPCGGINLKRRERMNGMKATQLLENLGQSLWLDNITRDLLDSGTLQHYINELAVTGLTSNPTIFDQAIRKSAAYDSDIAAIGPSAKSKEDLFFSLAVADLSQPADLFRPIFARTD